jgi:hypothetical protein
MESKTKQKAIYFTAAILLFVLVAGADLRNSWIWWMGCLYVTAAIFAFWRGGEPFGIYQKITMRPIFIWVGAFMMVAMFVFMLLYKEMLHHHYDHAPNTSLEPTSATPARAKTDGSVPGR